jgi:hypothetical protein
MQLSFLENQTFIQMYLPLQERMRTNWCFKVYIFTQQGIFCDIGSSHNTECSSSWDAIWPRPAHRPRISTEVPLPCMFQYMSVRFNHPRLCTIPFDSESVSFPVPLPVCSVLARLTTPAAVFPPYIPERSSSVKQVLALIPI